MKKTKFTEEQIAFALRQSETGIRIGEICRKMGISEATFYNWKKKYGGLGVTELRRLRQLEEENRKLKQIVADLSLDKQMLQDVLQKKALKPAGRRRLVDWLQSSYQISTRRACDVVVFHRSAYYYQSTRDNHKVLRGRICEIAQTRIRYGYRRIHVKKRVLYGY
jgi:transposase-like protein